MEHADRKDRKLIDFRSGNRSSSLLGGTTCVDLQAEMIGAMLNTVGTDIYDDIWTMLYPPNFIHNRMISISINILGDEILNYTNE